MYDLRWVHIKKVLLRHFWRLFNSHQFLNSSKIIVHRRGWVKGESPQRKTVDPRLLSKGPRNEPRGAFTFQRCIYKDAIHFHCHLVVCQWYSALWSWPATPPSITSAAISSTITFVDDQNFARSSDMKSLIPICCVTFMVVTVYSENEGWVWKDDEQKSEADKRCARFRLFYFFSFWMLNFQTISSYRVSFLR